MSILFVARAADVDHGVCNLQLFARPTNHITTFMLVETSSQVAVRPCWIGVALCLDSISCGTRLIVSPSRVLMFVVSTLTDIATCICCTASSNLGQACCEASLEQRNS